MTEPAWYDDLLCATFSAWEDGARADDADGVHVIHQLAQAGRTLVAVILNCRNADFRPLISPAIEGLRSCVGLLRRFSGRYLCGLRSADIIDEFCRSEYEHHTPSHEICSRVLTPLSLQHPR